MSGLIHSYDVNSLPHTTEIKELEEILHQAVMLNEPKEVRDKIRDQIWELHEKQKKFILDSFKNMPLMPIDNNARPMIEKVCAACGDGYPEHIQGPGLCPACLNFIGELRKRQQSWWFKE